VQVKLPALLSLSLLAGSALAQDPSPSPTDSPAEPDISITATVRWKTLRFEVVGTPRVELKGAPGTTVWEAERINLPRPVQPGVTYRDGGGDLRIEASYAQMIDSALAELQSPKVTAPPELPEPRR
jgi:hypothetical protein